MNQIVISLVICFLNGSNYYFLTRNKYLRAIPARAGEGGGRAPIGQLVFELLGSGRAQKDETIIEINSLIFYSIFYTKIWWKTILTKRNISWCVWKMLQNQCFAKSWKIICFSLYLGENYAAEKNQIDYFFVFFFNTLKSTEPDLSSSIISQNMPRWILFRRTLPYNSW